MAKRILKKNLSENPALLGNDLIASSGKILSSAPAAKPAPAKTSKAAQAELSANALGRSDADARLAAFGSSPPLLPDFSDGGPDTRVYVGDCRELLPRIPEVRENKVDLVFADPPFNWNRGYDKWDDQMPDAEYLGFTYTWIDLCIAALRPSGSMWINIPDDWAAEIVVHCKARGMKMINWCVWHYRFGQNTKRKFISSKVHALYFAKAPFEKTWNPLEVLEATDRATTYFDPRTNEKSDGMPPGKRVPLDVWYGPGFSRIQGNNKERRPGHDNQLPEAYLERVIRACSNTGDLIMDPFNGSGTTGTVARALGRRFIGTEYSQDLAAAAFDRITRIGPASALTGEVISSAIFKPRKASAKAISSTMKSLGAAGAAIGEQASEGLFMLGNG